MTRLNQPTVNMVITNVKCETITDKISTDYHKHCYPHLLLNLFHLGFVRNIHRIGHSFCFLSSLFQSFYRLQKHKYTAIHKLKALWTNFQNQITAGLHGPTFFQTSPVHPRTGPARPVAIPEK